MLKNTSVQRHKQTKQLTMASKEDAIVVVWIHDG